MDKRVKNILWWSPLIILYGAMPLSGDMQYILAVVFGLKVVYLVVAVFVSIVYSVFRIDTKKIFSC